MRLTALRPNNPVAVMAAYGALRLLPGARLRWDGLQPELDWDGDIVAALAERLPERLAAPENRLIDDPRQIEGPDEYRRLAEQMPSDWLLAYAAETADGLRATHLRLLGGPHKLIKNARAILEALSAKPVQEKIEEALIGPWRYEDRGLQAWGWDAAARIDASSSDKAVTSATKYGVLGAYWLAWESLPFWPMIAGRTVGMGRRHWSYPICANWLGAVELRALILAGERLDAREMAALGVTRWRSVRIKSGDYGQVLGWAVPVSARTSSERRNAGSFARGKMRHGSKD